MRSLSVYRKSSQISSAALTMMTQSEHYLVEYHCSSEVLEVVLIGLALVFVDSELTDFRLDHLSLDFDSADLLLTHAVHLFLDIVCEVQVIEDFLVVILFGLQVISLFSESVLLSGDALLLFERHAELAELE